jgi:hypothetical protein
MNRISVRHFCLVLFVVIYGGLAPMASADEHLANENLKDWLQSDLQRIKAEAAKNVDFLVLDGASNGNDAAQLRAFLGPESSLDSGTAKDIQSAFGTNEHTRIRFRAFPYTILSGPSKKPRNICIIKFDYSTHYTLDKLLGMLKTNRKLVEAKGIDLDKITAGRLLAHIWHHEVWHCMDMLGGKADSYAFMLDNTGYPMDTLYVAYKRFTEIGADVFASMLDMQEYGDPEVSRLIAYIRKQNLQLQDLEHYSSPAIMDVVKNRNKIRHYTLKQIVAATDSVRQKYTSSLDRFANMKDAYDPVDKDMGPIVLR